VCATASAPQRKGRIDGPTYRGARRYRQLEPRAASGPWRRMADGNRGRRVEGPPSSGTPRGHICSSARTAELPEAPDNVAIIDAIGQPGRTSSCTPSARRLPRLRDEHRQRRVKLCGRRSVLPALHSDRQRRRNTITGRWEIVEDGTNYTTDFDLHLPQSRHLTRTLH